MSQIMLPGDANPSGNVHGGVIMKLVDTAAGVCSTRHARRRTVTARIDSMSFLEPVYVGDLVTLTASLTDVGTTSLEVEVKVEAENLISGVVRHVSSAILVFVALDDEGKPTRVPPLVVESEVDRQRAAEAKLRRQRRQPGVAALRAIHSSLVSSSPLDSWKRSGLPFVLVGHRGAAGLAPENTMPSFELALALGADAIECDVHLSRDGVPVVIHDAAVDRTTDGHGAVSDFTVVELQSLDASRSAATGHPVLRIPTLNAVLRWAKDRIRVVIELKGTSYPELIPRTLENIQDLGMSDDVMLISFDHVALRQCRILAPAVFTGALYAHRPVDPVSVAVSAGADLICPLWSTVTPDAVSAAHAAGLGVCVWTTNEENEIRSAIVAGVDAVTTDFPDRARAIALRDR